ncbi:choline-sulfatase [Tothia fuscella]|uniref:Choline-sulfatase n=1 Tax=Tothia fuscella TaxID=1048955 RepID=A0A9P4U386_9PEZI|nr:choline-sulfatase [Tothia fuscella]
MAPHAESPRGDRNGFLDGPEIHNQKPFAKPNILYIMADQLAAPLLKMHDPNSLIQTPNIDDLSKTGVTFDNAYCNSPLCAPSRFCMVTGQLPGKIGAYDNASHLNADIPTYAHYLRTEGYECTLAGKMHFVGPDQLHGFENRLTSDIYPGDFGWAVNWDDPETRQEWFHNMLSVTQAGPCVRSNQLDFDEEVMHKSKQYLYNYVRGGDAKPPFCLTVSLTHPHDPYAITKDLWDQYEDVEIPLPKNEIRQEDQDSHSKRVLQCIDLWGKSIPKEAILRARRAYYAACTYVDNQVGILRKVLRDCGLDKNTIIMFSGDHGDMLGERSMWYKMSWFENSARVPLIINYPARFAPRRVKESVSTMDLLPTLLDLVEGNRKNLLPMDGRSLYPALHGQPLIDEVFGEYMGEGTVSPLVMIRRGRFKYIYCLDDDPLLYDLENDPEELKSLVNDYNHVAVALRFENEVHQKWDLNDLKEKVMISQRMRRLCWKALQIGQREHWDWQPKDIASEKYIRSHMPLDELELRARYPPVDAQGNTIFTNHPHGIAGAKGE